MRGTDYLPAKDFLLSYLYQIRALIHISYLAFLKVLLEIQVNESVLLALQ
ncbi:MAG: hypothetical protein K0Q73_9039 [Paenibacillus sp.]|nr:hypothetical protein [Paenibacillus sp.]